MLLISWFGNLRGRLVFSQRANRGGQTNRATASWVELCEPRFLLTLPDITEGMTESEIADAWADAEQDAEDELNDAISDLSDTADDMDTQFDTIGTAMRSGIAGAIGNQETQDGLAFAALDAQVLIIDAAFDAAVGPERDDYADDLATFEDDFNDGADDASDEFGTDSTDSNNTLNDDLTTAGNTYDSDVGDLQSTFNGIESTQRGILDTANTNAENDFNDDMDDANDQLTLDNTVADTFLTSSLSPFETIRDTNVAGLDPIYDSAVAGAAAVRDSVITLYTVTFDPNIEITNPVLLAALQSARDTYMGAIFTAQQDYQDDLDGALADFNGNVAGANDWFANQMEDNNDTLASDRQAAQDNYDSTLAMPRTNRTNDEQTARDNFDDAKEIADNDKRDQDDLAQDDYNDAITLANDDYAAAVDAATTDYENYATPRTATFQGAVTARTTLYQQQRDGYFDTFDAAMQAAQDDFDDDVADAKQIYVDAKRGFATTRDGQITTARNEYNDAVGDLADDRNDDYDDFWIAAYATMMTGGTVNYTPLYENQQQYEIGVAEKDVFLAFKIGMAKVQFNSDERTAATALAKSIADYTETLVIAQANASRTLAHNLADAQEPYQQDIADLDAAYEIDMQTEFVDLMQDIALAEWVQSYDYASAEQQLTIDLSESAWTHSYDVAAAQETFDKAMADAAHTFELAENGAFETMQNDLATAESTWIQSSADDAETRDNTINAAQADWIRDQYQAYVDYIADLGTAYLAYMPVLATVKSAQFILDNGATPDAIAVGTAWEAYTVAVAFAEVARANNTAAEWQAFGNQQATYVQLSEDMRATANKNYAYSVAAALVDRVSDEAAAQHTYDDEVAAAAHDFAHDEAEKFRTRTEQEADADKAFIQAMAGYEETYQQQFADAAYDYAIAYWNRHLPNFTIETNAERDRFKSEQTELKNIVKAKATNEQDAQVTAAGFAKTAAKGGADQDRRAAVDLARKDFAAAVMAAFDNLTATRARPLSSFEQAAMSRLDTWGFGAMASEMLHWAWNEGLDDATNFVTGWADALTGGAHGWVRQQLGIDGGVNYNSNAYAGGQIVGTVHGFFLGGASGAIRHAGWAYTAARTITMTATVYGGIQAANNIRNGNGTFWDYLALAPAVGYAAGRVTNGLGIFRCFVGDTPVVIREADNVAIAAAGIGDSAVVESDGSHATFVLLAAFSVSAGLLGKQALDNRQQRHDSITRGRRVSDCDMNDPNRCDLPSGPPPEKDAGRLPVLSPAEFDELFDQLLTGNASVDGQSFTKTRRGSPGPDASPTKGLTSQEVSEPQTSTALLEVSNKESPMFAVSKLPLATPTTQRTRRSKLGLAWMWGCLLLAGGFLWNGLVGSPREDHAMAAVHRKSVATTVPAPAKFVTKPIRDIRVGERVFAHNPEVSTSERADAVEPDQATWRQINLKMKKPDGSELRIEMLRPVEWLQSHAIALIDLETPGWFVREHLLVDSLRWEEGLVGRSIDLDLPEMGASGPARVLAIHPCPEIEASFDDGRQVVTATFQHSSGDILQVQIGDESEAIETTANHPFWSEDRLAFVPAAELSVGERLRRADNTSVRVKSLSPKNEVRLPVHNLEVATEHVYYVGEAGVLVHNQYHHVVSIYANNSRPAAAAAIRTSHTILANAGLSSGSRGINVRWIHSHIGRQHSERYHEIVAQRLVDAVSAHSPFTPAYTAAATNALDGIVLDIYLGVINLY